VGLFRRVGYLKENRVIKQEDLGLHMFSFWVVDIEGEQISIKMSLENAQMFCENRRENGEYYEVVGKLEF
jgi:hypothetical protein